MVVSRSPDNELMAMAALLVPHCSLASGSIAELLAELPTGLEQVLVICDDALLDSVAIELMCSVAAAAGAVLSAQRSTLWCKPYAACKAWMAHSDSA